MNKRIKKRKRPLTKKLTGIQSEELRSIESINEESIPTKWLKIMELLFYDFEEERPLTLREAATKIHVTYKTAFRWMQRSEFQNVMLYFVGKKLNLALAKATYKLYTLLDSRNEFVQLAAIKEIYDRAGLIPEMIANMMFEKTQVMTLEELVISKRIERGLEVPKEMKISGSSKKLLSTFNDEKFEYVD